MDSEKEKRGRAESDTPSFITETMRLSNGGEMLGELCPLKKAYEGRIEFAFDEDEETAYEIEENKWTYVANEHHEKLLLTKKGSEKLTEHIQTRTKSIYDGFQRIYGNKPDDIRIFYLFPSEWKSNVIIQGADFGEISLEYIYKKMDIGNEEIQVEIGGWMKKKRMKTAKLGDEYPDNWREVPVLNIEFHVRTMKQKQLDVITNFLDDFILFDLYQNNADAFKEHFSGLGDRKKESALIRIVNAGLENEDIEEWFSKEYKELSERSARRMMDYG